MKKKALLLTLLSCVVFVAYSRGVAAEANKIDSNSMFGASLRALGGTSMAYYNLPDEIKAEFEISVDNDEGNCKHHVVERTGIVDGVRVRRWDRTTVCPEVSPLAGKVTSYLKNGRYIRYFQDYDEGGLVGEILPNDN